MRISPHEVAIGILTDEFEEGYIPDPRTAFDGKPDALAFLRDLTGSDFGDDVEAWRAWFRECDRELLDLCYSEYFERHLSRRPSRKRS